MPARHNLATPRLSWLAIISACLAKIGILILARGDCGLGGNLRARHAMAAAAAVDVLVRPEGLTMQVVENGNGIVTTRTFLGSVTRVGVQLDGDVAVQIDKPSAEAAALAPGASVSVSLPAQPVLVAPRRAAD
jgi:hypothetical protein